MHCPKCGGEESVRRGFIGEAQRYRCKGCGCHFTRETPKGYPARMKELSVLLYVFGLSMNAIATLLGVSHQTSYRWIKDKAKALPGPEIRHKVTEVEIDEMCLYLKKRAVESGFGRCIAVDLGNSLPGMWVFAMRPN